MDPSLQTVLIIFLIYGIAGIAPLYGAYRSTTRLERFATGFFLIFYAAFMLLGLALVTGTADKLTGLETISLEERNQISGFMQYIIFGGFFFTLLFGSVGANIFTTAIINTDHSEISDILKRIEDKTNEIHRKVEVPHHYSKWLMATNILLIIIGFIILMSL